MAEASIVTRAAQNAEQGSAFVSTGASALAQTFLWLMVVVGLILLLAWLAKRLGGVHLQNAAGMKMLSILPVGNKEKVALIQVGEQQLLIGIAPGRVTTLHVFDEPVTGLPKSSPHSAETNPGEVTDESAAQKFQQVLLNSLTRKKT